MSEDAIARAKAIAARLSGHNVAFLTSFTLFTSNTIHQTSAKIESVGGSELGKRQAAVSSGPTVSKIVRIPVKENPDVNYVGLLLGPKGATLRAMSERTGCKIQLKGIGAAKGSEVEEPHAYLEGSEEAVAKAVDEIEELLYNPDKAGQLKSQQLNALKSQSSMGAGDMHSQGGPESIYGPGMGGGMPPSETMEVPNNIVGLLIGKGGEQIQRLQQQTGGNMQIQKENEMAPGATMRSVTLKGSFEQRSELRRQIDVIVSNAMESRSRVSAPSQSGTSSQLSHPFVVKVAVPNDKVGIIIGRQGSNVQGIMHRTRSYISIPGAPDEDNPEVRTVQIGAYSQEDANAAQEEIFSTLRASSEAAAGYPNSKPMTMAVPDDKVGMLIGKGGSNIKELQSRTRTRIQLGSGPDPGSNPPVRTITITGDSASQERAKTDIENMIAASNQPMGGGGYGGGYGGYQGGGYGGQQGGGYGGQGMYGQHPQYQQQQQYSQPQYTSQPSYAQQAPQQPQQNDPTAYYKDFWQYASYYGEAAARTYYGAWSPPEGTSPPQGIILPGATPTTGSAAGATVGEGGGGAGAGGTDAAKEAWEKYNREMAEWQKNYGGGAGTTAGAAGEGGTVEEKRPPPASSADEETSAHAEKRAKTED